MKKYLLIFVILITGFAFGQSKVKYGAKAGLNFSKLRGDLSHASVKPGFVFGGLANIKLNGKLALQPEVLYSPEGTHYTTYTSTENASVYTQNSLNLGYISIPLMLEYYVSKVSFEFGPQINFLTFAKLHTNTKSTLGDIITADAYSTTVKDQYNNTDFGLNFGVGYNFNPNLCGNLRYNWGFTNVNKDTGTTDYNSVVTFSFSYFFN